MHDNIPVPAMVTARAAHDSYTKDPSRWGSPEVAAFFPGFEHLDMATSGAVIRLRHGGQGPPLLLLHGNPQNHVCWHKIAARLAGRFHVVLPDLRGYGDSSLPAPGPDNGNFSFRPMALDMVEIMEALGYKEFMLAGHDRGARTAHRLCLDFPERVSRLCLMDILPNYYVWTNVTKNWGIKTWHWLFMAQPEPFPERLISAVPAEFYLKNRMIIRGGTGIAFFDDAAMNEYIRCYTLKTITGSCRDYRATATCDFALDTLDKDRQLAMPLMLLWGARGQVPERSAAFAAIWSQFASDIAHAEPVPCGHYLQEEEPDLIFERFMRFFAPGRSCRHPGGIMPAGAARDAATACDAWHVYLAACADGTLYCGIAKDPEKRLAEHNGVLPGGARYTRGRRPVVLLASRACAGKGEALRLERAIKSRPRHEKLSFMRNHRQEAIS